MNQQQQTQMPPNPSQGQVPDNRFDQVMEKVRQLELQNTQLRTTVDFLRQGGQQNPQNTQAAQQSAFKPEVADAIKALVNERLSPLETQHKQQIGYLVDQLDAAKFQLNYGNEKFKPYHDKVEQIRQQEIARGNYVPREDILRMVHFEETGKKDVKPQAPAPAPQQQPVFDPFFGTYVDPVTKQPIQGNQTFAPEEQPQNPQAQPPQMQPQMPQQFQPQTPAWQPQPQQQVQQQPQQFQVQPGARQPMQTQHPYGNAYGQNFGLPGQGVNTPAQSMNQPNPRAPLNLETATEADLEAFENSFGEIPL